MTDKDFTLSQEYLKECFDYNPEAGILIWKKRPLKHFCNQRYCNTVNTRHKGKQAGNELIHAISKKAYIQLNLNNKTLSAHRVIWQLVYGELPDQVDHKDGNGINNRLSNLRSVSGIENNKNQRLPKNNTSGHIGVTWLKRDHKWRAKIKINYKDIYLGGFDYKNDAIIARKMAEYEHGFHINHGSVRPL